MKAQKNELQQVIVFLRARDNAPLLDRFKAEAMEKNLFENMAVWEEEGKLSVFGSFEKGGGLLVFQSTSSNEVRAWLSESSLIKEGHYRTEVYPWILRRGSICLSSATDEVAKYHFIKYNSYINKSNVRQVPRLMEQHDRYLRGIAAESQVVIEGIFANDDGGVLVLEGDLNRNLILEDPTVKFGFMEVKIKKLTVNRGVFCEK